MYVGENLGLDLTGIDSCERTVHLNGCDRPVQQKEHEDHRGGDSEQGPARQGKPPDRNPVDQWFLLLAIAIAIVPAKHGHPLSAGGR